MSMKQFESKAARDLFGKSALAFGQVAGIILSNPVASRYSFLREDQIDHTDVGLVNRIFWEEVIQRSEICAYATLVRTSRWAEGAIISYEAQNLLGWSASARGLIEAVANSFYVLRFVASTLADNFETIRLCLSGEYTGILS